MARVLPPGRPVGVGAPAESRRDRLLGADRGEGGVLARGEGLWEGTGGKCGFQPGGRARGAFLNGGRSVDVLVYALLRDDPRPWHKSDWAGEAEPLRHWGGDHQMVPC